MGNVVWFEILGSDSAALQKFYGSLFDWKFNEAPGMPGYGVVDAEQTGVPGGVGKAPAGPGWTTFYVQVDDIAGSMAKAEASGGKTLMPPTKLPDGGIISVFADPVGNPVGLMQAPA